MNLKVGIVGLPNAGKSTLFNALLKKQVALAANYPFATIEPNIGVVPVPDARLTKLADIIEKTEGVRPPLIHATIEFVDIAGLVKGASEGQGLGNKFLSHIREVHLVCHVMRYFRDPDVAHVAGVVDPQRDREIIETELVLADLATLEKQQEPKGLINREAQKRWEVIVLLKKALNSGKQARNVITDPLEREIIKDLHLLTMKPVLYVLNVSENYFTQDQSINRFIDSSEPAILVSAKIETELAGFSEQDQQAYLKELGLSLSGLDRLSQKAYEMLGLITFLTCGVKESRAWTIKKGTNAPVAAGVIHTDFERKFIKADVIKFDDFVAMGGWTKAREAGKVRSEGKEYIMKNGDVVEFKIGT